MITFRIYWLVSLSFEKHLQFTIDIGSSGLHFLDLTITIKDNNLETSVQSNLLDAQLCLNAKSSHPNSQILGIAKRAYLR